MALWGGILVGPRRGRFTVLTQSPLRKEGWFKRSYSKTREPVVSPGVRLDQAKELQEIGKAGGSHTNALPMEANEHVYLDIFDEDKALGYPTRSSKRKKQRRRWICFGRRLRRIGIASTIRAKKLLIVDPLFATRYDVGFVQRFESENWTTRHTNASAKALGIFILWFCFYGFNSGSVIIVAGAWALVAVS